MTSTRTTKALLTRQSASLNLTTAEYDGPLPCLEARIGPDVALSRAQSCPDCAVMRAPVPPLCQCERGASLFACGCVRNFKCTIAILIAHQKNTGGGPRANPTPRWALHLLSIRSKCFGVSKSLLAHPFTICSIYVAVGKALRFYNCRGGSWHFNRHSPPAASAAGCERRFCAPRRRHPHPDAAVVA